MSSPGFDYKDSLLHCEDISLAKIAGDVGTPTYVYGLSGIHAAYDAIDGSLSFARHLIAYAIKANSNLGILSSLARRGSGADIVSAGELLRCLHAGIPPERIVFSGVGKRDEEIELAIDKGIRAIHVESVPELDIIESIAARKGVDVPITLRVNPDVDAETHPYIATGLRESKFGIEIPVARSLLGRIVCSRHLRFEGLACHVGSQLTRIEPLEEAVSIVARFAVECRNAGAKLRSIDAGGGWPLAYGNEAQSFPSFEAFGQAIYRGLQAGGLRPDELELFVEPGRALVGSAVLLSRVLFVKEQGAKRFVIIDAAMTELIRPALYQAHHEITPIERREAAAPMLVDVVGPVCESGDFLALDRTLPEVTRGDLLAIHGAGAYGMTMASNYNSRQRAAEVLVHRDRYQVVRTREPIESLWRDERCVDFQ